VDFFDLSPTPLERAGSISKNRFKVFTSQHQRLTMHTP
jgi:hypothetical protein